MNRSKKLISKDSLIVTDLKSKDKKSLADEKDFTEVEGITIDDTKTKVGKDFYDEFYMQYSRSENKKSPVRITETPTMGRSSKITIKMDDKEIYAFLSNSSQDYITEQTQIALKAISEYSRKKELIQYEFKY